MILPEIQTKLSIYLNKDFLTNFIYYITKLKYFHIIDANESKLNLENNFDDDKICCALSNAEYEDILKLMKFFENYYEEIQIMINSIGIDEDIEEFAVDEVEIEFKSIIKLVEHLVDVSENEFLRLNRIIKQLEIITLKLEELVEISSVLKLLKRYGDNLKITDSMTKLNFQIYLTSKINFKEIKSLIIQNEEPIVIEGLEIAPNKIGFFVLYEKEYSEKFFELFLNYNCHNIEISERYLEYTQINFDNLQSDYLKLSNRRNEIIEEIKKIKPEILYKLKFMDEMHQNINKYMNIIRNFEIDTNLDIIKIQGYMPEFLSKKFVNLIKKKYGGNIDIESEIIKRKNPYDSHSNKEEKESKTKIPTFIRLNKYVAPFQVLLKQYGITNYSEIEPTLVIAITFPLIFGLMFGDTGHGLILVISSIFLSQILKKNGKSTDFSVILLYCGIGAIFGGLLYGEFFGNHIIINGHEFFLLTPPIDNIILLLKFSVIVGVSIIILGWIIKMINLIINNKPMQAFFIPFIKIWLLIGGTYLLLNYSFNIFQWFEPPYPILLVIIPTVLLLVLSLINNKIEHDKKENKEDSGGFILESLIDFAETFLQIISNVASFVRIVALEMAHIGLMVVVWEISKIIGASGSTISSIITFFVLILGNAFVIILELIIVFIHTLRLHFYEFFSKFYIGDGISFNIINITNDYCKFTFGHIENHSFTIDDELNKLQNSIKIFQTSISNIIKK